ncbi:MAG: hypothetical protein DCC67_13930 [Planctomycetota bacterium]|nr:MAG: hypothetical protein DCC67_13930 [Planctomycetota bacterium]
MIFCQLRRRQAANHSRWGVHGVAAAAALGLAVIGGCEQTAQSPAAPTVQMPVPKSDTPEGKLARVVDRLKAALKDAQAAAGSGIVSERTASSRLLTPAEEGQPLKAEVTIHTVVAMDQSAAKEADAAVDPAEEGDEPVVEATGEQAPVEAAPLSEPIERKSVFELVYRDDRWQLATELTDEQATERLCFQYALEE